LADEDRKGIYLYDYPQIVLDHQGNKIINYILDVDECADFKLLSIFPLLCSHLVYLNVNQQVKYEKLAVIPKRQAGLLEIFAFFMDIVQVDNLLGGASLVNISKDFDMQLVLDLENRTKQMQKYMPELVWVLNNDLTNVTYPLPRDFDSQTLNDFLMRDYSRDSQQNKIINVFQTLFTHKTLINLPSDFQQDQQKYNKQWDSQVQKLR